VHEGGDCVDEKETALLEQARAAWRAEQWDVAAARYEELLELQPDAPGSHLWWFDAALAYKFLRNWPKAFELGRQAAARSEPGRRDPAFWNLGIAATIQGDWAVARQAWSGYGVTLPAGDGEIEGDFGTACVRLVTGQAPEVVWVRRICPTRGRVTSVPFSDRRFGEIVVHDGAPNGERVLDGRRYPVFDELLLWKASATPTFRATVSCDCAADLDSLGDLAEAADDTAVESVAGMVVHAREESEGRIEPARDPARAGGHDILIAAPDRASARALLENWAAAGVGRAWQGLREQRGFVQPPEPGPGQDPGPGPGRTHGHGHKHDDDGSHPVGPHPVWPFEDGNFPAGLGVVAHRSLLTGAASPRRVVHDRDGWWQALDGASPAEPEHAVLSCMMCLVELHPELAELADLPPGWAAEREQPGAAWRRGEGPHDEAE
jgi:hypothetical protein